MQRILLFLCCLLLAFPLARNYVGEQFFPSPLATQFVDVVERFQEIKLPFFYGRTFNPGVVKNKGGYLLSFRSNAHGFSSWIKHNLLLERKIYLNFTLLNERFIPEGEIASFADSGQDARLIQVGEVVYAVYNEECEEEGRSVRRMFLSEVVVEGRKIALSHRQKLIFPKTAAFAEQGLISLDREKNWSPFVHAGELYFVYLIAPHVVLRADPKSGLCSEVAQNPSFPFWPYNTPCGGTPALAIGEENLAFFHANTLTENRWGKKLDRGGYYFGAYTFSTQFPFQVLRRTLVPLYPSKLPWARRKIVYPTALLEEGDHYLLFAGVTDCKVYLFVINKEKLDTLLL